MNDCSESYGKGVNQTAYIVAYDDIDWDSVSADFTISSLPLVDGAYMYRFKIPSKTPFTGMNTTSDDPTIGESYTRSASVVLLPDSPNSAKNISALNTQKHVMIFEKNIRGEDGSQAFIVYGLEQGLYGSGMVQDSYSDDSLGGWAGSLVESGATIPQIFLGTDYATTKAALEAAVYVEPIALESFALVTDDKLVASNADSSYDLSLEVGDTYQIQIIPTPSDASDYTVEYIYDDDDADTVSVSETGLVTALAVNSLAPCSVKAKTSSDSSSIEQHLIRIAITAAVE